MKQVWPQEKKREREGWVEDLRLPWSKKGSARLFESQGHHQKIPVSPRSGPALEFLLYSVSDWEQPVGSLALGQKWWWISKHRSWALHLLTLPVVGGLVGTFSVTVRETGEYCVSKGKRILTAFLGTLSTTLASFKISKLGLRGTELRVLAVQWALPLSLSCLQNVLCVAVATMPVNWFLKSNNFILAFLFLSPFLQFSSFSLFYFSLSVSHFTLVP